MKKICFLLLLLSAQLRAQPLRVAVAANAQFVMEQLRSRFQQKTGITVESIVNSSGKLTTQIQQGAPYDVFLSADMTYPQTLHQQGLTVDAPVVYAYGSLVLWTLKDVPLRADLRILQQPSVRHVAIASPATAPYGEAAVSVLTAARLLTDVTPKIVYGESIAQVNQYILSGAAEIGFTAKSVVLDPAMKGRGRWIELPAASYKPIAQGAVVLTRSQQLPAARRFMAFLRSPDARKILATYGYRAPAL